MIRIVILAISLFFHGPLYAEADGPDAWQVYGIEENSVLNMRLGPSTKFRVVGKLRANSTDLENLGCFPEFSSIEWESFSQKERQLVVDMRWCKIRYRQTTGWVYGKYLEEY
ncbi:MAG: SH3 domain-containing protein [Acidiferrobacterales bacterium]|nr:SH3 domain-containing protein [Acidiferrobacterales bacterium]